MRLTRRDLLAGVAAATALPIGARAQLMPWGRRATAPTGGPPSCSWGTPTILAALEGSTAAYLQGVSSDGTIAVGSSSIGLLQYGVTWTNLGAPVALPLLNLDATNASDFAAGVNGDNSKIFGYDDSTGTDLVVVWESGTVTALPLGDYVAAGIGGYNCICNSDGTLVVGVGITSGGAIRAALWKYDGAAWSVIDLGSLPGDPTSNAYGISWDGSTIVGTSLNSDGYARAVYWQLVEGVWTINELPYTGTPGTERNDRPFSAYGSSIIVGQLAAFDEFGVLTAGEWINGVLTILPGTNRYAAYCISADGSLIGGTNPDSDGNIHGTVWLPGSPNTYTFLPDPVGYSGTAEVDALSLDGEVAGGNGAVGGPGSVPLIWSCT